MMETIRFCRTAIIGLFFPGLFFFVQQSYAEPVQAVTKATPEQGLEMVRETSRRLLESIEQERLDVNPNQNRLYELIDEIVFSKFDFYRISSRILGRDWRKATSEQKVQFIDQFKIYLVRTYATALNKYRGQEIEYLPVRTGKSTRVIKVQTRVELMDADPINIDYVLLLSQNGSWKIVDILVEGISLVVTHRSSFRMELKEKGLSGLIVKLKEHNQGDT
ncbi:MAG: phospholipid transport system substrate-binding protein [Candidatus Kentron sp. G]|nr:MAG: phospholipid transport system substrate-binding protein [Candidatus Kentron sp. G]